MLLFRSLSIGLIAACFLLQIERGQVATAPPPPAQRTAKSIPPPPLAATIIDVAGSVDATQRSALVRLQSDEHVTEVDDRLVGSDLEAGAAIAEHGSGYIDLTVESATSTRRVLMLLH